MFFVVSYDLLTDHIKDALTKNKNPLKKLQNITPLFYSKKIQKRPQIIQNYPRAFPLKNTKKTPNISKNPKNDNKAFIVIFGVHFVIFGAFFVFFRGKTVGQFSFFFRAKKVGKF
jgi:hypothetical protein